MILGFPLKRYRLKIILTSGMLMQSYSIESETSKFCIQCSCHGKKKKKKITAKQQDNGSKAIKVQQQKKCVRFRTFNNQCLVISLKMLRVKYQYTTYLNGCIVFCLKLVRVVFPSLAIMCIELGICAHHYVLSPAEP